jgi:hypothetical protein
MAADRDGLAAQEAAEAARRAAGKMGLQVLEKQVRRRPRTGEHCWATGNVGCMYTLCHSTQRTLSKAD